MITFAQQCDLAWQSHPSIWRLAL